MILISCGGFVLKNFIGYVSIGLVGGVWVLGVGVNVGVFWVVFVWSWVIIVVLMLVFDCKSNDIFLMFDLMRVVVV